MRVAILSLILILAAFTAAAAEKPPRDVWSAFDGAEEELEAETLELRDELIPAHLAFMSSLELATNELPDLTLDDLRLALAWARVEYLLETSFRLLAGTGEYDAFLQASTALRPVIPVAAATEEDVPARAEENTLDGGLVYSDAAGHALVVGTDDAGLPVLLSPETDAPPATLDGVSAAPALPEDEPYHAFIPLIRARAAWLRALALERLGKSAEAGEETAPLGLIRDWAVLGPIEQTADAFDIFRDEESGILPAFAADPAAGKPAWTPAPAPDPLGRVFPGSMFRSDKAKSAVFLALVEAAADGPAVLRFGATAAVAAGVNQVNVVYPRDGGLADPDQEALAVWMRRGWNIVLVRTVSGGGDWSFTARLTTTDGKPFAGRVMPVTGETLPEMLALAKARAAASRLERFYSPPRLPDSGGVSIVSAWIDRHPEDARGNFYLASLLVSRRLMEGPERFDREGIFHRAMDISGRNPFFTLMAARSIDSGLDGPDREENLRLVLLRSVADKGSAAAIVDIGRLYLDVMRTPRRAAEYADIARGVNPLSLRAGILHYDVAIAMDWRPLAGTLLKELVLRHPSSAAVRLRLGRAALAAGQHGRALSDFHAVLAVDAGNSEALSGAVVALGMLGQTSAAADLLLQHIALFPCDFSLRLKLANLYRTLGRDAEADAAVSEALATAPDDPAALAMRRGLVRESSAVSLPPDRAEDGHRQEIDFSPPDTPPPNGWEYLYFEVTDNVEDSGALRRNVSFAARVHTERAARTLRNLSLWLDRDLEESRVRRLEIVQPDGTRRRVTNSHASGPDDILRFDLPPLESGMVVEAEVEITREPAAFLGGYFGHTAPLAQMAPVRLSRYIFISSKDFRVFFRPLNDAPEAMVVESGEGRTITRIWEMPDIPAFSPEPFGPGQDDLAPSIQVSSFADWNEFARWYWRLIGVQYHAPPELLTLAGRMGEAGGVPMVKLDRAAVWISRNIGTRGWEYGPYAFRPINARSILSRLTADSKDRTLILCLLAREFGLEAWPVLARFRSGPQPTPGSARLALPLLDHFNYSLTLVNSRLGGGVFMDAGNPRRPPAVMPAELSGSRAMAITPERAERILIPDAGSQACFWRTEEEMVVDSDGSILWEERLQTSGAAAEHLRAMFPDAETADAVWEAFLRDNGCDVSTSKGELPPHPAEPNRADFAGRARLRRFARLEGDSIVLTVPPLPGDGGGYLRDLPAIASRGERKHDLILPHGFGLRRKITIRHPPEWRLANAASSFSRTYPFGAVSRTCAAGEGEVVLEFAVDIPGYRVQAAAYPQFREMTALLGRYARPVLVWERQ